MNTLKIFQIISITIPIAFVLSLLLAEKKNRGLSYAQVFIALGIKVLLGTLYGYLFYTYYNGDDTWYFFNESVPQTKLLLRDPGAFFKEFSPDSAFINNPGFARGIITYLGDLEYFVQVKMLAIFNLVTVYDYYLDMCLLNGVFFFGHYLLYRLIMTRYPGNQVFVFTLIFCFFPAVFWLSGVRADGYLFLFTSVTLYSVNRLLNKSSFTGYVGVVLGLTGVLIFRPAFAALLILAISVWMLIEIGKRRPGLAFFGVYGIAVIVFFGSGLLNSNKGLPALVVSKQEAFFRLDGKTRFDLDTLKPDPYSFVKLTPAALNNTLLRPFPWEAKGWLQSMAVLENLL
ncbi:MAG TPA: hypothetical protein VLC28_07555, partial [Flavitalea sp.]|nr:hypothetical protein [Flavitalea sp.]